MTCPADPKPICGALDFHAAAELVRSIPDDILYVLEKFQLAVMGLATSTFGLRERLTDAYKSGVGT
jgi:hypothetical protein